MTETKKLGLRNGRQPTSSVTSGFSYLNDLNTTRIITASTIDMSVMIAISTQPRLNRKTGWGYWSGGVGVGVGVGVSVGVGVGVDFDDDLLSEDDDEPPEDELPPEEFEPDAFTVIKTVLDRTVTGSDALSVSAQVTLTELVPATKMYVELSVPTFAALTFHW
jgi:hypothetical protein